MKPPSRISIQRESFIAFGIGVFWQRGAYPVSIVMSLPLCRVFVGIGKSKWEV